jgi:hypothetical protein
MRMGAYAPMPCRTAYMRHDSLASSPPLPIHEINGVAYRVVDPQVHQDELDLVLNDIRSYVTEVQTAPYRAASGYQVPWSAGAHRPS